MGRLREQVNGRARNLNRDAEQLELKRFQRVCMRVSPFVDVMSLLFLFMIFLDILVIDM
jgi:hypothetical protein